MFIALALIFFLILGAASASEDGNVSSIQNSNDDSDILSSDINLQENLSSSSGEELSDFNDDELSADENSSSDVADEKKVTLKVVSPSTIIRGDNFEVKLTDDKGKVISGKTVSILLNGKTYNRTTNSKGIASLTLNCLKKYYTIEYSFKEDGYTSVNGKSKILVITNIQSSIKGSNYVAYRGLVNPYTIQLTVDGIKLSNQKIRFNINGKNYYKTTDANGKASLNINLAKGTYIIRYYYNGAVNIDSASGKSKITVKQGIPVKVSKANSVRYYSNVISPFKVKVLDSRGNPVKGHLIFKINNKKYSRNLYDGVATINLKLKYGTYKIYYYFYKTSIYNKASGSYNVYVKVSNKCINNGYWIFGYDMKNVNLDSLAKTSTKHIFLNYAALSKHGKSAVETFISNANKKGMKVHIWMQIFYNGNWVSPVNSDGSYKYSFFNSKINEAKSYASLKGVAGVHLDYLRFPGTAYKHTNGVNAINYFTKQLCSAVHKINSKLIVSAAVMPEPSSMKYYYGQDIPTISKYLDVLIPMIYKGNYASGTSWIKSTTQEFIKMSNGAEVWTGIQSYNSDDDVTPLSSAQLLKDYQAASSGGATGVISFRWGISKLVNFSCV